MNLFFRSRQLIRRNVLLCRMMIIAVLYKKSGNNTKINAFRCSKNVISCSFPLQLCFGLFCKQRIQILIKSSSFSEWWQNKEVTCFLFIGDTLRCKKPVQSASLVASASSLLLHQRRLRSRFKIRIYSLGTWPKHSFEQTIQWTSLRWNITKGTPPCSCSKKAKRNHWIEVFYIVIKWWTSLS